VSIQASSLTEEPKASRSAWMGLESTDRQSSELNSSRPTSRLLPFRHAV
jgi:hypothetical protein